MMFPFDWLSKTFGKDLDSARALNQLLCGLFDESQIYRIDHYLGKETVQNILAFRFVNSIWNPSGTEITYSMCRYL